MQPPWKAGILENGVLPCPSYSATAAAPLPPAPSLTDLDFQVKSQDVTPVITLCSTALHLRDSRETIWPALQKQVAVV